MPKKTNKTERTQLRLPPRLKSRLMAEATRESRTLNDHCIMILSNEKTAECLSQEVKARKEIIRLYAEMGNNINQMAKFCNATRTSATPQQLKYVLQSADHLAEQIMTAFTGRRRDDADT